MDITSTNSRVILTVQGLFPAGVSLEKFSTDQSFAGEEEVFGEVRMGVDGKIAGGYIPSIKTVNLSFEADSPSLTALEQIVRIQETSGRLLSCDLLISVPSLSRRYSFTNGMLVKGTVLPAGRKVLSPVSYKFQFEQRQIQPI